MDPLQTAAAVCSGVIVGFTLGLVGGGGSILALPLLLYVVGMPDPHLAIGTSAVAVAVNAFANLVPHARERHVRWYPALVFAGAGLAGAYVGRGVGLHAVSQPAVTVPRADPPPHYPREFALRRDAAAEPSNHITTDGEWRSR